MRSADRPDAEQAGGGRGHALAGALIVALVAVPVAIARPGGDASAGSAATAQSAAPVTCKKNGNRGCVRYVNRGKGAAASFRTRGRVPFTVRRSNRGRVKSLNADMVDGKHASELRGETGPAGPAGPPGQPATSLWAVVDNGPSCTLTRGSGALSVETVGVSRCDVKFDRDVSACVVAATIAETASADIASVTYSEHPNPDPSGLTRDEVYAATTRGHDPVAERHDFYLVLFC